MHWLALDFELVYVRQDNQNIRHDLHVLAFSLG
jgi:hypothetical protein